MRSNCVPTNAATALAALLLLCLAIVPFALVGWLLGRSETAPPPHTATSRASVRHFTADPCARECQRACQPPEVCR